MSSGAAILGVGREFVACTFCCRLVSSSRLNVMSFPCEIASLVLRLRSQLSLAIVSLSRSCGVTRDMVFPTILDGVVVLERCTCVSSMGLYGEFGWVMPLESSL